MRETDLPPKPDPRSGDPRPPHAPLERDWSGPEDKHKNGASKVPRPPEGEGPMLEWFCAAPGRGVHFIVILLVIFIGFLTVRDGGFGWATNWVLWAIMAPFVVFVWFANRNTRMSAGADWLCYGKKSFIKTYELTEVKATTGGAARYLELKDRQGNALSVQLNDVQLNRELWDLVYNGILHSVYIHGAETNQLAKDFLGLNLPPQYWQQR